MWGTETITWVTRACSDQWFFTACTGTSSRFLSKLFFFQMRNGTRGTEKWRRKSEKTKQKGRASIGELVSRVFPRVSIFRITEVTHFAADHWSPVKRWRSTGFGLDSSSSSSSSFLSLRSTAAVEGRGRSQRGGRGQRGGGAQSGDSPQRVHRHSAGSRNLMSMCDLRPCSRLPRGSKHTVSVTTRSRRNVSRQHMHSWDRNNNNNKIRKSIWKKKTVHHQVFVFGSYKLRFTVEQREKKNRPQMVLHHDFHCSVDPQGGPNEASTIIFLHKFWCHQTKNHQIKGFFFESGSPRGSADPSRGSQGLDDMWTKEKFWLAAEATRFDGKYGDGNVRGVIEETVGSSADRKRADRLKRTF